MYIGWSNQTKIDEWRKEMRPKLIQLNNDGRLSCLYRYIKDDQCTNLIGIVRMYITEKNFMNEFYIRLI